MKLKMKFFSPFSIGVLVTALVTLACSLFTLKLPEVVNHAPPQTVIDSEIFADAGCRLGNEIQRCTPDSQLGKLGCQAISTPKDTIGGLTPSYPINLCTTRSPSPSQPLPENEYIYTDGCLMRNYVRYVIYKDGQFQLIQSLAALQQTYAPIETEDEALSFAAAATGLSANFGMVTTREYQYFVEELEDSFARKTDDGFIVHLFDYQLCGCGPHPTYGVDILVSPDGRIQELSRTKLYQDPDEDSLCID